MKKPLSIFVFLSVCLWHTAGLGYATFGQDLETRNYKLTTDFTAYTNAEGNVYTMAYDALGRMTVATNALNEQVFRAWYDNVGNLTNKINGRGMSIRHTYDALNRLTATFTNGTAVAQRISDFTYDAVGNMLTASNATAQLSFAYDVMDRVTNAVTKINNINYPTQWKRDLGGLVTNLTYATGKSVAFTHDEDGLLSSAKDWLGNEWAITRDAAGKITGVSSPNGINSNYGYDEVSRLTSWNVGNISGRTITYDNANRRIHDDITHGTMPKPTLQRTALNEFDKADKLISASVRYGQGADSTEHITETFLYDGNGALTNWISGTNTFSLAYNALGQVTGVRTFLSAYGYDALGNRVIADNKLFIPDHADPLKRPLMECDVNGNVVRYYIWGDNKLLGFIENDVLTVAHCDDFGSIVALTDINGAVLYSANYSPHGADWGSFGDNPTPFTWLGGYGVQTLETDTPLKLYLTRHRVYSATLNRFLSSDPLGLQGGLNLYAYGEGNPLSYIDPLGLCAQNTTIGFGFGDYLYDVGQMFMGYGDAIAGTVSGLYNAVTHPIQTVQNLWNAVTHPIDTATAMWGTTVDSFNSGYRGAGEVIGNVLIAAGTAVAPFASGGSAAAITPARQGGLNLYKSGSPQATATQGWTTGDRMLYLPNQGSPQANWAANAGALRAEMRLGQPIFDSYRNVNGTQIPTTGFLNAERYLLESRGWIYNPQQGAYLPPR